MWPSEVHESTKSMTNGYYHIDCVCVSAVRCHSWNTYIDRNMYAVRVLTAKTHKRNTKIMESYHDLVRLWISRIFCWILCVLRAQIFFLHINTQLPFLNTKFHFSLLRECIFNATMEWMPRWMPFTIHKCISNTRKIRTITKFSCHISQSLFIFTFRVCLVKHVCYSNLQHFMLPKEFRCVWNKYWEDLHIIAVG